jgi:SAM-dependent methyltransferase
MMLDPLAGCTWSASKTVAGFSQAPPNPALLRFVEDERQRRQVRRVLDLGCGAGRNAGPLADSGLDVVGIDLSWPMLRAAKSRPQTGKFPLRLSLAPMAALPFRDRGFDLVIAHGIWNLARSSAEFRRAVSEAARVSKRGAGLFVFTFSRNTLPKDAAPVSGETFVFTQFSGQPQCFLTEWELVSELGRSGFAPDPLGPLTEHNRPRPGDLHKPGGPVIYEGTFRMTA